MKNLKRLLATLAATALLFSAAACTSTENSTPEAAESGTEAAALYTPGTYTASAEGNNGPVTVEVTFSETGITAVEVTEHSETEGLADPALERIPATIVSGQTLAVDAVSGATYTSNAILAAVEDAVVQAGGDVAALQTAPEKEENTTVEELNTQLVIVGAGAAGMTAAVEASNQGLDVIVIEKGASVGVSNGAVAGGPIAVGTTVQAEEGEALTAEELYQHMYNYSHGTVNATLLRNTLEATTESVQLFIDLGIETWLRPDNFDIGFRARHGFRVKGVDRMGPLQEAAEESGATFLFETAGEHLLTNDAGDVIGVEAKQADGTTLHIYSDAVLLCTGGYLGSEELLAEKFGNVTINALGSTLSTGDGIRMTLEVGGIEDRNWGLISNEFGGSNQKYGGWTSNKAGGNHNLVYPVYGGLLVNAAGERFMNEEIMATLPLSEGGESLVRAGTFFSVIDQAYFEGTAAEGGIYEYLGSPADWVVGANTLVGYPLDNNEADLAEAIEQGWAYKADTIEELAEYFGLENLTETVEEYNAMCAAGYDPMFGKSSTFLTPISEGPFYVFEYEPSAWGTLGGVKVDEHFRAVDANNQPITGLYVAGVDAGSLYCVPYYDNEGAAFGLALGSGTVSAREIIEFIAGNS